MNNLEAARLKHTNSIDQPVIVVIKNPLKPEIKEHDFVEKGGTVAQHLDGYDLVTLPCLILYNSEPLLEADWATTTLSAGDVLTIVTEPGYGPGVVALWVIVAITLLTTAYSLYVVLTLDQPDPGERGDSPNYSVGSGSRPRPGQPMPVIYGNIKTFPDLSGQYSVYVDNEQILYQLFDVTLGYIEPTTADKIFFEDTPITSFDDYEIEHVEPNAVSRLFPSGVIDVSAVDKIELLTALEFTAAYTINTIDNPIREITFTLSSPQGSFGIDDKGRYYSVPSPYRVQYREVGTGTWTWWDETIASTDGVPVNQSTTYKVIDGPVYEARVARLNNKSYKSHDSNTLYWSGLSATEVSSSAKQTSRLAIKIRASNALGNASLSKMSVVVQRRLSQWNGSTWTAPSNTNSAVWAFADMCKANYGGRHADKLIDLDHLLALSAGDDEFNAIFDSKNTLWDSLNSVARIMNGRAVQRPGGIYSIIRDLPSQPPVALFNSRNIVKGSYGVEHTIPTDSDVNFVRVTYKSKVENYREVSVDCVPYLVTPREPYEVRLRGCTDNQVAYDIGLFMANSNLWRRARVAFTTVLEGFIPQYGDTIRVGCYVSGLEQTVRSISGEIRSNSGVNLYPYEDLDSLIGVSDTQIYLMDIDGSPYGPISCDVFASVNEQNLIQLSSSPPANIMVYGDDHQGPKFVIGAGSDFLQEVKVTKTARITGKEHQVRIEGVIDHPGAYAGDAAVNPSPLPPPIDASPKISNLFAELYGSDGNVKARLTWTGKYADYYIVDMSLDGGATSWSVLGRPTQPNFNAILPQVDGITVRVRGVSLFIGNSLTVLIDVLSRGITYPGVFDLRPKTPFTGDLINVEWQQLRRGEHAVIKFLVLGEVLRITRVDETVTEAMLTRDEVMAVYAQSVQGQLFPAVGCREVTVRMHGTALVNGAWVESTEYTELIMKNEPMLTVHDLQFRELQTSLSLSFKWPDPSPGGVYVYMSITPGFQPTLANMVFFGTTNSLTLTNVLIYPETYFVVVAAFDSWGPDDLSYSNEYMFSTTQGSDYVLPPIEGSMLGPFLGSRIDGIDGGIEVAYSGGLQQQYTVKIQSENGYVAGYGLAVTDNDDTTGGSFSEFFVLVDRFAVASPGSSHLSFMVENGLVKMTGARIANASIQNAAIGNVISSTNWDPETRAYGWHIDKTGEIQATQITIRDRYGSIILQSGPSIARYGPGIGNLYNGEAVLNSDPDFLRILDNNDGGGGPVAGTPSYSVAGNPILTGSQSGGWAVRMAPGEGFIDGAEFAVMPGETLYYAMKSVHGAGADSIGGLLVQCLDINMTPVVPEYQWALYSDFSENNGSLQLFTSSMETPAQCQWMRLYPFSANTVGDFSVSHVGVSRAPMELTHEVLPTYIKNAAIDTLTIAGAAVTAHYIDNFGFVTSGTSWTTVATVFITVSQGTIRVDWDITPDLTKHGYPTYTRLCRVTVDSQALPAPYAEVENDKFDDEFDRFLVLKGYSGVTFAQGLSIGSHTVRLQLRSYTRIHNANGGLITVTEAKR